MLADLDDLRKCKTAAETLGAKLEVAEKGLEEAKANASLLEERLKKSNDSTNSCGLRLTVREKPLLRSALKLVFFRLGWMVLAMLLLLLPVLTQMRCRGMVALDPSCRLILLPSQWRNGCALASPGSLSFWTELPILRLHPVLRTSLMR